MSCETNSSYFPPSSGGGGGTVLSVTGLNTDNTDPSNPVVEISVDNSTITGSGTPADPLVAHVSGDVHTITGNLVNNTDPLNIVINAKISADAGNNLSLGADGLPYYHSSPSGVTSIATTAPLTGGPITSIGTIGITQCTGSLDGYLSHTDWNTFNNKQNAVTLTTIGSSGASTFNGSTGALNIPHYTLAGLGGISASFLSGSSPINYNNGTGVISHANTDGFMHVPATGTTNNGRVLMAGATPGSFSWIDLNIPVVTPSALTKTDDTNVTITLSGSPSTSLLQAVGLTLGWTGHLSTSRGGTGLSSIGSANQLLRVNASGTALEYFTPSYITFAVQSVTGLNTDNTDPSNPVVKISVDGSTVTGDGTPSNPLSASAGTVSVDNVTIGGSGGVYNPLRTIMPVYDYISLTGSDYLAITEGVYNITNGTNPLSPYNFILPYASSPEMQGKRIIINNVDNSGYGVNLGSGSAIYYRGTTVVSDVVPPGATYEYVSIQVKSQWTWVNITPVEVIFRNIDLSIKFDALTYGVYEVTTATNPSAGYPFNFPDPATCIGQTITITNLDGVYPVRTNYTNYNIKYQGSSTDFKYIPVGATVEFMSHGNAWRSKPQRAEMYYSGINLSTGANYNLSTPGIYQVNVASATTETLVFPPTKGMVGESITIWNADGVNNANISSSVASVTQADGVTVTNVPSGAVHTFKCFNDGDQWILVSER